MNGNLLVSNARYLDVASGQWREGDLRIQDGLFVDAGIPLPAQGEDRLDAAGKYVLPGLIDCHVHLTAVTADLSLLTELSPSYVAFGAARIMKAMLSRGFTSVRDVGGADYGIHEAQKEGLLVGPRVFFGGKALSQTGGHGDPRSRGRNTRDDHYYCRPSLARLADGVDAVRLAAREELRRGAHHVKIMAGGGVASPTDRIDSTQYSLPEIQAIVEEAEAANRYVTAHAYTARSINRALRAGVRGIEHGNLLDDESIALLRERQAFITMNLVTYWALQEEGREHGLSEENWSRVATVLDSGQEALGRAHAGGVNPAYGSDLLGGMHRYQAKEFSIRAQTIPTIDVIRSATTVAAALLNREGELGTIGPGAVGDLVITDDDPLADIEVLSQSRLRYVIQNGRIVFETAMADQESCRAPTLRRSRKPRVGTSD